MSDHMNRLPLVSYERLWTLPAHAGWTGSTVVCISKLLTISSLVALDLC